MIEQFMLKIIFISLAAVPIIGFLDYLVFYKHLKCQHCAKDAGDWRQFMLPCLVESFMFITGLVIGYFLKF
jgi:hypothetical protein